MKITGLDRLQRRLEDISRRAELLDGQSIPIRQLMPPEFIQRHTRFLSFDDFATSGGWDGTASSLSTVGAPWDEFVARETQFRDWSEMLRSAAVDWSKKAIFDDPAG